MMLRGLSWNVHRGPAVVHYTMQSAPEAKDRLSSSLRLQHLEKSFSPDKPQQKGLLEPGTEKVSLSHLGYCLQAQGRLRNARNNTNTNKSS